MQVLHQEQYVTLGVGILGLTVFCATCYAGLRLCRKHHHIGAYALCLASILMSFGFALDSVSWAILTKGWGHLSMDDQPQWSIEQAIGSIPIYIILTGLSVMPIGLLLLTRGLTNKSGEQD